MALKALMLKKTIDGKRSALEKLNREAEFEKRSAEIEAAINEMTEESTPEEREAVNAEIDQLDSDKKENAQAITNLREEIEALEKALDEEEKSQEVPEDNDPEERKDKKMDEIITRDSKEYVDAFADYIKGKKEAKDLRGMLLTENAEGTVAVPSIVYDTIKTAWEKEGIMSLVKKSYLRGNLKIGFEVSGSPAVVHEEGDTAIDPENLVLGIVELVPKSIKKVVQVSDEALDMGGEAFLRYIYEELSYRIAKLAADAIIDEIVNLPAASTATQPAAPEVTASTISVGTIAQAIANLSDEASNPVVVMNKLTWGAFKAAQAANGYAYDPFEGLQVVFNNSIPAFSAASSGDAYAIVGDFGYGALANFPNGEEIEIKLDTFSLKKQDLVEVFGRKYIGLGVVAPAAFVKIVK